MASVDQIEIYALIADIGGTNARMQLIKFHRDDKKATEVKTQFLKTEDFPTFDDCLDAFLGEFKGTPQWPHNATCAVAAAPFENKLKMVNCHWPQMDGNALAEKYNIKPFNLINDFEAIGYSLLKIPNENLVPLTSVEKIEGKSMSVVGSGTGLGECILNAAKDKNGNFQYHVCPTEGGHKDFAPTDKLDLEYLQYCLENVPEVKQYKYLSVERSFCGPAIPSMYEFFSKREGAELQKITSKEIFQKGLKKEDPVCAKVLEYYARLLGKEVSNFALDSLPYAGIYLVGGMINSVSDYFTKDPDCPFTKAYLSKDKVTNAVLARFPIFIVTYDELGLLGSFVKAQLDAFGESNVHTKLNK